MPEADGGKLRCPTCGAVQEPSAECRRCKCGLSLVVATLQLRRRVHREALTHLRGGRPVEALQAARREWSISADAASAQLLVVCCLVNSRFQAALSARDLAVEIEANGN